MTESSKVILGLGVLGFIGYTGYLHSKINKMSTMIEVAVDKVADTLDVDISDELLNVATSRAVDREVGYISKRIQQDVSLEIRSKVKDSVDKTSSEIKSSVTREISQQVSKIDISDIEREVINRAKDAVAEKFDRKLDGLLDDFNSNLANIQKIYSSIARTVAKD